MIVEVSINGMIIKIHNTGGEAKLSTGKVVNLKGKFKIGQHVLVYNNIILSAEEKP